MTTDERECSQGWRGKAELIAMLSTLDSNEEDCLTTTGSPNQKHGNSVLFLYPFTPHKSLPFGKVGTQNVKQKVGCEMKKFRKKEKDFSLALPL